MSQSDMAPSSGTGGPSGPARQRSFLGAYTKNVRRFGVPLLLLVAGGVIALLGEHFLIGPRTASEVRVLTFQNWRIVCPPEGQENTRCTLTEDVVRDQGGTLVSLALDDTALGSSLAVTVPHGVLLDPGLGFSTGNDPLKVHPYETCSAVGCLAMVSIDEAMLKALKGNTDGQVVVVPGNGSPVTIPFSLRGFSEGYDALTRENARRTSMWGFLSR